MKDHFGREIKEGAHLIVSTMDYSTASLKFVIVIKVSPKSVLVQRVNPKYAGDKNEPFRVYSTENSVILDPWTVLQVT